MHCLSEGRVRNSDHSGFLYVTKVVEGILDFNRANLFATAVDHVTLARHEIEIAVVVTSKEVTCVQYFFAWENTGL
jgi:hypothetical protein